jgi:hypothetical protein
MVRDCRAGKPEGWLCLVSNYVPVIRKLLAHYDPPRAGDASVMERILVSLRKPESSIFQSLEPAPERWFVAELRQVVLLSLDAPRPEIGIDLETVAAALDPLTLVEKQVAWIETMQYGPAETSLMLRMAPKTVEKIRDKAGELIRGKVDAWRRDLLANNGLALGRAAAAAGGKDCLSAKIFLDVLDGRANWQGRSEMEQHVRGCWHCIDHFSRMAEVVELIRDIEPLRETEAAPFRKLLGVDAEKRPVWKRWF